MSHSFAYRMANRTGTTAQRIRIGLTSLAVVFLFVLIGSIISRSGRDDNAAATDTSFTNETEPKEPLAELGVAPGSTPEEPAPASNEAD